MGFSDLLFCRRIYPPEDKALLEKYDSLLSVAFQTFLSGRAASFQRELNNPLKKMKVKGRGFQYRKKGLISLLSKSKPP